MTAAILSQILGPLLHADRMTGRILTVRGQTDDGTPCDLDYSRHRIARVAVSFRSGVIALFMPSDLAPCRLGELRDFILSYDTEPAHDSR